MYPANSTANPEENKSALQSGKNIFATNPITCGRVNADIFESDDVNSVSNLSPNNKRTCRANGANFPPLSRSKAHALKTF